MSCAFSPAPVCEHITSIANIRDFLKPQLLPVEMITKPLQFKITANTSSNEPNLFHRTHPDQAWNDSGRIFMHNSTMEFENVPDYKPKSFDPDYIKKLKSGLEVLKKLMNEEQYQENLEDIEETSNSVSVPFSWIRNGTFLKETQVPNGNTSGLNRLVDIDSQIRNQSGPVIQNSDLVQQFIIDLQKDDHETSIKALTLKKNMFVAAVPEAGDCE
jgi:hypothetical protein